MLPEFWEQEQDYTDELLITLIALYYVMLIYGMQGGSDALPAGVALTTLASLDKDKLRELAAHPSEAMQGIMDTTKTQVDAIVTEWKANGGGDLELLQQALDPVFSDSRAELIAITETTQTFQDGNELIWALVADAIGGKRWVTKNDERVCEICGPLHLQVFPLDSPTRPPAHPRCRCYMVPDLNE